MSVAQVMTASFGRGKTGLAGTVGYKITGGVRTTAGITELAAGSGSYVATVTFPDGFSGTILWDTGGGSPVYASEAVNLANTGAVTLPDPAPDGYGPIGTGSRIVDHDYPSANDLKFQTSGGVGIGGALVRVYLAGEFAANPNTASVRGQTLTLDSGAWANVIDLDPGSYKVVFKAEGYETTVVDLTVS